MPSPATTIRVTRRYHRRAARRRVRRRPKRFFGARSEALRRRSRATVQAPDSSARTLPRCRSSTPAPGALGVLTWSLRMRWLATRLALASRRAERRHRRVRRLPRADGRRGARSLDGARQGPHRRRQPVRGSRRARSTNQIVLAHELLHTLRATDKYSPSVERAVVSRRLRGAGRAAVAAADQGGAHGRPHPARRAARRDAARSARGRHRRCHGARDRLAELPLRLTP